MVSKEEYKEFVRKLVKKDVNNINLKYMGKGYLILTILLLIMSCVAFVVGMPLIFAMGYTFAYYLEIFSVLGFILVIIGFINIYKTNKYYKNNYRRKVIDYLLAGAEYHFDENEFIDESIFENSQFGGYYERYKGSDLLVVNIPNDDGTKSNVNLTLCDLDVTKTETDSDGDSRTVTVYKGMFGYIEFPFEFKCVLGIDSYYSKKGMKIEKVKLEDINFDKIFKVYSNDQIEARYLLTPDMMNKLLYLNSKLKNVKITLVHNKMYIGASWVNMFEMGDFKNNDIMTLFEDFYDQVEGILSIVNEIKNNNKIFKM